MKASLLLLLGWMHLLQAFRPAPVLPRRGLHTALAKAAPSIKKSTSQVAKKPNKPKAATLAGKPKPKPKPKAATKPKAVDEREELVSEIVRQILAGNRNLDDMMLSTSLPAGTSASDKGHTDLLNGVVRVYCTHSPPNFAMPWQRLKQEFSSSTGFVIEGRRILTNAHAVEFGSLIQVKKRESEDKYVASVAAVGHECDLAILTVEDDKFWEGMLPLKFGGVPELLEEVSVIGYPVGGDSLSISNGVVSRIEMQEYAQASAQLLAIQIDAAINPGNSGGPVINNDNEVIGVAFQSLSEEDIENIGYVVPSNVVDHFLDDVARHGAYSGVCGLGVRLQGMENEMLRKHHGMASHETGVLVLSAAPLCPAATMLLKNDVLLKVDDIRIANDGTIPFREGTFKERVQVSYYFTQRFSGEIVSLEILRKGQRIVVQVPLWVPKKLIPRTLTQKNVINTLTNEGTGYKGSIVGGVPSYMMIGGLVLMALSKEYLQAEFNPENMGDFESWADEFKLLAMADLAQAEFGEEVVILSQVIAHDCNRGYEMHRNMHLKHFNGVKVTSLKQLKGLIDAVQAEACAKKPKAKAGRSKKGATGIVSSLEAPLIFEFSAGSCIVLEAEAAFSAQSQIASEHFINSSASDDLK